jgi:hypothetical protein
MRMMDGAVAVPGVVGVLFGVGERGRKSRKSKVKIEIPTPSASSGQALNRTKRDLGWGALQQNLGLAGEPPACTLGPKITYKRLGERAEAAFLAKASRLGFGVAKAWGDSDWYDFIVDASQILREERSGFRQESPASKECSLTPPKRLNLWRVQVKSAHTAGRDGGYSLRLFGHSVGAYREDEIDVLICYLAPEDAWYVFPPEVFRGRRSVKLFGGSRRRRSKFEKYREGWWVLGRREH